MAILDEDFCFEISDDLLEGVTGGVLTESQEAAIRTLITMLKQRGYTKQDLIATFTEAYSGSDPDECIAYADMMWDQIP